MFKINNEAERAIIYLYGTIGYDYWDEESSNTAKSFSKTLDKLDKKPLDIHIDSLGGDVYEGFGIASAIQRYEGYTTIYIDGIAASAASYIAVMGDKVVMTQYSQIMIHNAWTYCSGNAEELIRQAEQLRGIDQQIAGIIAGRSGMSVDDVAEAMSKETWYTAEDSLENGLCDEVLEVKQRRAASLDREIMKNFKNVPDAIKSHADATINNSTEQRRSALLGNKVYLV